jgi:hypothetical protein
VPAPLLSNQPSGVEWEVEWEMLLEPPQRLTSWYRLSGLPVADCTPGWQASRSAAVLPPELDRCVIGLSIAQGTKAEAAAQAEAAQRGMAGEPAVQVRGVLQLFMFRRSVSSHQQRVCCTRGSQNYG